MAWDLPFKNEEAVNEPEENQAKANNARSLQAVHEGLRDATTNRGFAL